LAQPSEGPKEADLLGRTDSIGDEEEAQRRIVRVRIQLQSPDRGMGRREAAAQALGE
jgi:hypothetical protein